MANKKSTGRKKNTGKKNQNSEVIQWITIVILSAFIIVGLMRMGVVGTGLYNLQRYLFGHLFWLVLMLVIGIIFINMMNVRSGTPKQNPAPVILVIAAILLACAYAEIQDGTTGFEPLTNFFVNAKFYFVDPVDTEVGGGILGALLYGVVSALLGRAGVILVIVVLFVIAMLLLVPLDVYKDFFANTKAFFEIPEGDEQEEPEPEEEKVQPNLWNMIKEHKEKKMANITAEEEPEEPTDTSILTERPAQKEEPQPQQPVMRTLKNITADGPTQEIQVVQIPGKVVSGKDSIFINVDDILEKDRNKQPVYSEPEPVYEEEYDYDEPEEPAEQPVKSEQAVTAPKHAKPAQTTAQPKRRKGPYRLPPATLFDPMPQKNQNLENEIAAKEKGESLIRILQNFDIEAQLIDTHIGPSVTQFEVRPEANVKVSRILGLTDNIKMQLAAKDVRIEAPIPGRNAVGVEIPNQKSTPVKMREIYNSVPDRKSPLLFYVGKDLLGQPVTCNLAKMPHLLIAGATGSGKSVCMNSIITSILMRTKPEDVKLLLVDPKKVEFTPYHSIPHLIGPVINDPTEASTALKVIVQMMDERYNIFSMTGVRNIEVYNEKVRQQNGQPNEDGSPAPKPMPYIVVIIDELADLMSVAGKEVEQSIQRITQLARAAGIHLIVATQRPSVDVITGIIKANIPSRIAFAVSSGTDSRTILDHVGAERLLGYGDMLYMPIGQNAPQRVQGVFVTDEEVKRITDYVSAQAVPMYDDKFVMLEDIGNGGGGGGMSLSDDPLMKEVTEYVIEAQKASTSLLQRRFGIGYNRAARMIDQLEADGIIGPAQGSKPRDVYKKPAE